VQQEVDNELKGNPPTFNDVPKLKKCRNAIQETLRLAPPAPTVDRVATEDCELAGHFIPKGTTLLLGLFGAMLDEKVWDDVWTFKPDRFDDPVIAKNFVAFSLGYRNCVGQRFAMIEATILIAFLVQNFDIYIGKEEVVGVFEGTYTPANLKCKFVSRR